MMSPPNNPPTSIATIVTSARNEFRRPCFQTTTRGLRPFARRSDVVTAELFEHARTLIPAPSGDELHREHEDRERELPEVVHDPGTDRVRDRIEDRLRAADQLLELVAQVLDRQEPEPERRHRDAGERQPGEQVVTARVRLARRVDADRERDAAREQHAPERELRRLPEIAADRLGNGLVRALALAPVADEEVAHEVDVLLRQCFIEAEVLAHALSTRGITTVLAPDLGRIRAELAHEHEHEHRGDREHDNRGDGATPNVLQHLDVPAAPSSPFAT